MIRLTLLILASWMVVSPAVHARTFVPLSANGLPQTNGGLHARTVKAEDKPAIPGLRPFEVELLEDALRRKMPKTIGNSRQRAHAKIIRNSLRDPMKRAHLKGILAEALFLEKNPEWGYVRSPTASQHDVYTWIAGRKAPFTGQIKTHASADPTVYAKDMIRDHRSALFLLPDDHVAPLKSHLSAQLKQQEAAGLSSDALKTRRHLSRIRGLGFTSKELDRYYARAARYAYREQYAGYISLGAATAMALGPELWNFLQSGDAPQGSLLTLMSISASLGTERTANYLISRNSGSTLPAQQIKGAAPNRLGDGSLRGTLRGNGLVGMFVLTTDTAFSVYQHGGRQAFQSEGFYTNLGGGVSALTIGMLCGMPVAEIVTTMAANPAIGGAAGLGAGVVIGTAAHFAGQHATRTVLEAVQPEFMLNREHAAVRNAKELIGIRLNKAING